MHTVAQNQTRTVIFPDLPLAIYREIEAHLRQVEGVVPSLLPQTGSQFDYSQSQIGGLQIDYTETWQESDRPLIESILNYYRERYFSTRTL
ncbi:MAG: hypothetical protein N5P05_000055 [Chroococcopsis gigantea SAG 12.99]|nr:hypothetical protein [Chlorogloea purpurea SAG 13.99]MDV2998449.1 hypothetical protein [Chroococcopsis gigantea SAG 12.99]